MHGLVVLDANKKVLRPAILWNDTRTTKQCNEIKRKIGDNFQKITGNIPLEGFTLPKLLWVKENEPNIWKKVQTFLLPKDYLRYQMTGKICTDFSDATGTVLLNIRNHCWSKTICDAFDIPMSICPKLSESMDYVGNITPDFSRLSGLPTSVKVYCGGGDNACGALGAAILNPNVLLSSIGTSGVVLKYEGEHLRDYHGQLQMECHTVPNTYYSMGVTLSAGHSLDWFKNNFLQNISYKSMMHKIANRPIGSNGLVFTPYLFGERAPYNNSFVRGSFIGVDGMQTKFDFARSIMEGIVFSFRDIISIYKRSQNSFDKIIAIGGGSKSSLWLQMQADIFNKPVVPLIGEQGPGFGACMLAAVGVGWFNSLEDCANACVSYGKPYIPIKENVIQYNSLYAIYKSVYKQTAGLSKRLIEFRQCSRS